MTYSLNETEALARKAVRGAHYPWGLSDDAGRAVRWLCLQGYDGIGDLRRCLDRGYGRSLSNHVPRRIDVPWQGNGALCPLASGVTLSDCAARLKTDRFVMLRVADPRLLLPFLGMAARRIDRPVRIECNAMWAVTDGRRSQVNGTFPPFAERLRVVACDVDVVATRAVVDRVDPRPPDWAGLEAYAARTYAPATEASREKGAGAGTTDND